MAEGLLSFQLCGYCKDRQGAAAGVALAQEDSDCFICRGISSDLEKPVKKIVSNLKKFESRTFSIGLVLPAGVQEREDILRSDLKIRGGETVKSQLAGRLAREVARSIRGKKLDRMHPDATVLLDLGTGAVEVTSKPLFLYGLYTKPRGVAQRSLFCENCNGRGCDSCKGTGLSSSPSVEGIVSKRLGELLGSAKFKFTWFGSEDVDSEVFPPGRPMVVESKNPRKRRTPRTLRLRARKGTLVVSGLKQVTKKLEHPAFTFMTRAFIQAERKPSPDEMRRLQKGMRNSVVQFRNNKGRLVDKKIYSLRADARGKKITAEIKLDGGLPVKRLVSGEAVSPSLSEALGIPLRCERFDILRVWPRRLGP